MRCLAGTGRQHGEKRDAADDAQCGGAVRVWHPRQDLRRRGAAAMAGGHGGRVAVAQVTDQESLLSPYRRSLFEARSSRATIFLPAPCRVVRDNKCSMVTPIRGSLRRQAT